MDRIKVESSNIESIGYDPVTQTLEVEFHYRGGSIYQYKKVPPEIHEGLMNAESKGKYLNAKIKGAYEYESVEGGK